MVRIRNLLLALAVSSIYLVGGNYINIMGYCCSSNSVIVAAKLTGYNHLLNYTLDIFSKEVNKTTIQCVYYGKEFLQCGARIIPGRSSVQFKVLNKTNTLWLSSEFQVHTKQCCSCYHESSISEETDFVKITLDRIISMQETQTSEVIVYGRNLGSQYKKICETKLKKSFTMTSNFMLRIESYVTLPWDSLAPEYFSNILLVIDSGNQCYHMVATQYFDKINMEMKSKHNRCTFDYESNVLKVEPKKTMLSRNWSALQVLVNGVILKKIEINNMNETMLIQSKEDVKNISLVYKKCSKCVKVELPCKLRSLVQPVIAYDVSEANDVNENSGNILEESSKNQVEYILVGIILVFVFLCLLGFGYFFYRTRSAREENSNSSSSHTDGYVYDQDNDCIVRVN